MRRTNLHPRVLRTGVLIAMSIVLLGVFALRLFYLQVVQHSKWAERSAQNHLSKRVLDMKRGNIYDRNGVELAISVDTYSVYIFTRELKSLPEAAKQLAAVLPMTREEIIEKVGDRSGYIQIIKELEPSLAVKLQRLAIPGVNLEKHYQRFYPQKTLASTVIGFTGAEKTGLEGLELLYDKTLRGYPGLAVQEDISISNGSVPQMRVVTPPRGGSNIYLTIDSFVQHTLETELASLAEQYHPIDATAIVMQPYTGEILGMAVLPNYDLNNFSLAKAEERRNRVVTDIYEPGSCMKICAVASAIEDGKVTPETRFYCRGYGELKYGKDKREKRRMRCHGAHGLLDANEAIRQSCNSAMLQISQMIEPGVLYRTYKNFGFGDVTGIDAVGESQGLLAPPSKWSAFTESSLCIGQEMAVTGIQLVRAYCAIANGGILLKPRLVKRISSPDSDIVQDFEAEEIRRVIQPSTAKWLRKMLRGVVEGGTGKQALLEDYTIGGKTSTAQKANPKGGYFNDKLVVSFIGMAPALEPKFVLLLAANEPKGDEKTLFGGKVTGKTFASIVDKLLKHMKVMPDRYLTASAKEKQLKQIINLPNLLNGQKQTETTASLTLEPKLKIGVMPNLLGLSMKKAMQILNKLKIKAVYEGCGLVIKQSIPEGRPVLASEILRLELSGDL